MIKGDHFSNVEQVLLPFGFSAIESSEEVSTWDEVCARVRSQHCPWRISRKVLMRCKGWTVVLDLEAVMWTNTAACERVSQLLGGPIFAMVCGGVAGSNAFRYFDHQLVRGVWYDSDSGFLENKGRRLPEERGLHTEKMLTQSDVLRVLKRLGVDYSAFSTLRNFQIHDLIFSAQTDALPRA